MSASSSLRDFRAAVGWGVREGATYWYLRRVLGDHHEEFLRIWSVTDAIPGWLTKANAAVLYELIRSSPVRTIVEIGSYLGRSSIFFGLCMRSLQPGGRVIAVDPHTGDRQQLETLAADRLPSHELFLQHLRATGLEDVITPVVDTSVNAAAAWGGTVDLVYVDGWHSYDAVVQDVNSWLPHLAATGTLVFDDYLEYAEVHSAVNELAARGAMHLWGQAFGHAFAGPRREPPEGLHRVLALMERRLARRLYRAPRVAAPAPPAAEQS